MKYLIQDEKTGYYNKLTDSPDSELYDGFLRTHSPDECSDHPCAIHNTSSIHRLSMAPLFWRDDIKILERICSHGVGHPDKDAADYLTSIGKGAANIHGCDGCC